jgi:hypothetical protein
MEAALLEEMEKMKIKFSIFYAYILEKPYSLELIEEIRTQNFEISEQHSSKEKTLDNLRKAALRSGRYSDLNVLSNYQLLFDKFSKGCEEQQNLLVTMIQNIEIELLSANNTSPKNEPTNDPKSLIVAPKPPVSSMIIIRDLGVKFYLLLTSYISFYRTMKFEKNDFQLATENVEIDKNPIIIETSDVRGDGACGFRAILTSYLFMLKIHLPRDPIDMQKFILELKILMQDLLVILNENSENQDFVNGLLSNPANGVQKANIADWYEMIKENSYECTDGDIRLISMLFGLLRERDRIPQINVLKLKPTEHNPYQSFNSNGTTDIVPVDSKSHLNIIHTGGHYRMVMSFTGSLPPIYGIDANIIIPSG